jgi:1-acyl-sn-glycerol-3-phosphate acyltransferase
MVFLRSAVFHVLFYIVLVGLMIVGLPYAFMPRKKMLDLPKLWGRVSLFLLDHVCGLKVEFRGLEHLPAGGVIIAAKHQSFLETFAMPTQLGDFTYVLKRELMAIPVFGWYLRTAEQLAIDRSKRMNALIQVAKEARSVLAQNRQIVIFPEGTRKLVGAPPDYKAGVALVQAETGAICVPVALNTGLFWPRKGFARRPGRAVIEFLEPIAPGSDRKRFMALLQDRIETASAKLAAEAFADDPALRQFALPEASSPSVKPSAETNRSQ